MDPRIDCNRIIGSVIDYSVEQMQQFVSATLNYAQIFEAKTAFNTNLQYN